jgi:mitogen-activated protein kinase organizer 1
MPPLPSTPTHALSGHEGAILAVRFNSAGTYALSCGKDRTLRLWNPHTGVGVKTYTGERERERERKKS